MSIVQKDRIGLYGYIVQILVSIQNTPTKWRLSWTYSVKYLVCSTQSLKYNCSFCRPSWLTTRRSKSWGTCSVRPSLSQGALTWSGSRVLWKHKEVVQMARNRLTTLIMMTDTAPANIMVAMMITHHTTSMGMTNRRDRVLETLTKVGRFSKENTNRLTKVESTDSLITRRWHPNRWELLERSLTRDLMLGRCSSKCSIWLVRFKESCGI